MWTIVSPQILARFPHQSSNGSANGVHNAIVSCAGWDEALKELDGYRTYGDDWDGQGAAGIPSELIDGAVALAATLKRGGVAAPQCVVPGVQGTVVFEWDLPDGGSISLDVVEPGTADLFLFSPTRPTEHLVLTEVVTV
jgi:hypothetical protein